MQDTQTLVMNWRSALLGLTMLMTGLVLGYLFLRQIERRAVIWLCGFVLSALITAIPMVIGFAGAYDIWPGLTFLPTDLSLFFGPLLLFHGHSLMIGSPLGWRRWLLAPGLAHWLYQLGAFTLLGDYRAKWAYNDAIHEPYIVPLVFLTGLGLSIWALVEIWRMRGHYLAWLADNRSDDDVFRPSWLTHLILMGVPLIFVSVTGTISAHLFQWSYVDRFWTDFAALVLLFVISLEALIRIQVPFPKMSGSVALGAPDAEAAPPLTANTAEATTPRPDLRDWTAEGARLQDSIIDNGWHLEPGLSLNELARRMGTNQAYLSRAFNQGLGTSFSTFINGLRIDHAKALIRERKDTILDIAFASGFGSKASFNRAFKLHTAQTPSDFIRQIEAAGEKNSETDSE